MTGRYGDLVKRSPGLIGIHDLDGTVRYMNPAAARALGYEPSEMVGRNFNDFIAPPVRPLFALAMERLRQESAAEGLVAVVTKDGAQRIWWYRHVLCTQPGKPPYVLGDSTDVTDIRGADEALHESEERFRYLAENIRQVFWIRDPRSGEILYLSPAFEEVWGRPRQPLLEVPFSFVDTIHPEDQGFVLQNFAKSAQGERTAMEYRIVRPDGTHRWIWSQSFPVRDDSGKVTRIVAITEDITERKHAEEALRQAKEGAEAATRAKSELLAHVSHEVRTPLQVITGMTEILGETSLDVAQRADLSRIEAASRSLLKLANDLLDFSRVEARKLDLQVEPFSVRATVQLAMDPFLAIARTKGLALRAEVAPEVPEMVVGDAERLRQVLANVIGNAAKFTDHGEVSVEVGIVDGPPPTASQSDVQAGITLRFCVRDTGPGIPAENRARIFEPFSQPHTETKHDFGGVGLGLAICARLVHLMGGKIGVESELGHGSTFHFTACFGRS